MRNFSMDFQVLSVGAKLYYIGVYFYHLKQVCDFSRDI